MVSHMSILFTGATGFLGSRLLYALLVEEGREVTALGRGTPAALRARIVTSLAGLAGGPLPQAALDRLHCLVGDVSGRAWPCRPPTTAGSRGERPPSGTVPPISRSPRHLSR